VITGQLGEEMALQALNLGAEDYLLKGQIEMAVLGRTVRHAYERRRIQAAFGASDSAHTLQETVSFEQLVATVSNRFISMGPHELDRAVQEALERIGGFFDVERVALYEFSRESGELQEARFWLAEQNPGLGVWPTQTEFPGFPHLNAYLDREGSFVANKIEDIPESWEGGAALGRGDRQQGRRRRPRRAQRLLPRPDPARFDVAAAAVGADVVPRLRMLGEIVAGTIVRQRAELDREQLLTRIQEQARAMQQLIETVPEGVVMLSREGVVLLANPIAQELLERLAGATTGDQIERLGDKSLAELLVQLPRGEWHAVSYNGRHHEITSRPVRSDEAAGGYVLVIRDVTHEREMQERAQQQDRLAAVGQLAAGVAHDFNNIMSVITLYASGTRYDSSLPPELQKRLGIIQEQAKRAAALIEQILDFGRHTPLESLPLNLVTFLKEAVNLLQRTLPENIQVDFTYPDRSLVVSADPTRMQQAIMNLAVNARDAMPDGGRLTIQLEEVVVAQPADAPLANMSPGTWVQITVSDTGSGVPEAALPHIFEPFYTTKEPGKGTGLGLAQVYGIVKQHGGEVDVRTRLGEGTTFHILLPALPSAPRGNGGGGRPAGANRQGRDDPARRRRRRDPLCPRRYARGAQLQRAGGDPGPGSAGSLRGAWRADRPHPQRRRHARHGRAGALPRPAGARPAGEDHPAHRPRHGRRPAGAHRRRRPRLDAQASAHRRAGPRSRRRPRALGRAAAGGECKMLCVTRKSL
jgi:signal transduction histidine kinase